MVLLGSYPLLRVEITEPAEGPVGLPALMRFQQSSDEMTGSTAWVKEIPTWSPMADDYITEERNGEPVTPSASMVDYTTLNYNQETGFVVKSEAHTTVMEEVWYWSPLPGRRIVYNQFYYPGWHAYLLDGPGGKPVQQLPIIPEEEGTLGRMTVPVPVGEGYVRLCSRIRRRVWWGACIAQLTAVMLALGWIDRLGGIVERRLRNDGFRESDRVEGQPGEVDCAAAADGGGRRDGRIGRAVWCAGVCAPIISRPTSISTPIAGSKDSDRRAEVVFAIHNDDGRDWVHAKPHYPTHIFRLPSGGVHWDEQVETALLREVEEETGLPVAIERFIGLVEYRFWRQQSSVKFASYIFALHSLQDARPVCRAGETISEFRAVSPAACPNCRKLAQLERRPARLGPMAGRGPRPRLRLSVQLRESLCECRYLG